MATHPNYDQKGDLVAITVKVDGSPISDKVQIHGFSVYKSLYKISTAKIEIQDGNISDAEFETIKNYSYVHGAEIEIESGYHDNKDVIFKGIIVKHSVKISSNKGSKVILECADKAIRMTGQRRFAYHAEMKDSDIINQIISVEKDVDSTNKVHEMVVQHNTSDWDFVVTRAQANKMVVSNVDGKVLVKKPKTEGAKVKVTYGESIIDLDLAIDGRSQIKELKASAWDPKNQEVTTSDAKEPEEVDKLGTMKGKKMATSLSYEPTELHSTGNMDTDELKQWADGSLLMSRLSRVRGTIKVQGVKIDPNETVEITSVGSYYDGEGYVSGVYHEQKEGNWTTEIELGISPDLFVKQKNDINLPVADGLFPGVHGLFIGKVAQIADDPLGEYRVRVIFPMVTGLEGDGVWCRVSSLMAGNQFGAFFYPALNDEVVCGTLGGDLRFPIVLGALHSSTSYQIPEEDNTYPNTFVNTDDNHHKGFLTREKLMLHFDDEKKVITIETPGGRRIEMNDDSKEIIIEDDYKNKLVMDSNGFEFTGQKKFIVNVTGNVELNSKQDIKAATNTGNFDVKALKSKVEGSTGATLKSPSSTFEAGLAFATVSGPMVKIN